MVPKRYAHRFNSCHLPQFTQLFTKNTMSAITVETLIKELEQVKDKQAKVVIQRNLGTYDIDRIVLPGQDEDYLILVVDGIGSDAPVGNTGDAEGDEG